MFPSLDANGPRGALFLLPNDRVGGAERVLWSLAVEAARSDYFASVEVVIVSGPRTGTLSKLESLPKVRVVYLGCRWKPLGILLALAHMTGRHHALVLSSAADINAVCSLARRTRLLKTSRLVTRESTMIFERDFGRRGALIRALYRLYGAQDLVICQTDRMRDSLDRNTGGRLRHLLRVIPNPVDLAGIANGTSNELDALQPLPKFGFLIVWCGRLVQAKAPLRAIQTLSAIHQLGREDAHLVMIGDGPMRGDIEAAARDLKLHDHVTLLGHQARPSEVMSRCSIGLVTSDVEGFPNVVLEMLAAGVRAVVTTDCAGGLDQIPGVLVATEKSPATLAAAICRSPDAADSAAVRAFIAQRSPATFLQQVLS